MGDRLSKIVIAALLVVLAVYVAQPYVDRWLFSASTPRTVEPGGSLSDIERTSIDSFEHAAPSVVRVVGRAGALEVPQAESENGPAQSGSGFVWDAAGHIVTNDHVVEGTSSLAVRFASGQVLRAHIVGTAPNDDLAVIRVDNPRSLPPAKGRRPAPAGEASSSCAPARAPPPSAPECAASARAAERWATSSSG